MKSNESRILLSALIMVILICAVVIVLTTLFKPIAPAETQGMAQDTNAINPPSFGRVFDTLSEQDDICFINGVPQIVDIGGVGETSHFITYLNNDGDIVTLSVDWLAILSPNNTARYVTDLGNNEVGCDNVDND